MIVGMMNLGHRALAAWGLSFLRAPRGRVSGVDYSAIQQGRIPNGCALVLLLSQRHVQDHHEAEANGEENRADVGVGSLGHFRN